MKWLPALALLANTTYACPQTDYPEHETFCGDRQAGVDALVERARTDEHESYWFHLPDDQLFINATRDADYDESSPDHRLQTLLAWSGTYFEEWHTHPRKGIEHRIAEEATAGTPVENPNTMLFPSRKDLMWTTYDDRTRAVINEHWGVFYQVREPLEKTLLFLFNPDTHAVIQTYDEQTLGVNPDAIPELFDGTIGKYSIEFIRPTFKE